MKTQNNEQLVIHDSALMVWIAGALLAFFAALSLVLFPTKILVFFPTTIQMFKFENPVLFVIGLALLLSYPYLIIKTNHNMRSLRLEYRYLLFYRVREIPFDDIKSIHVQKSSSSSNGRSSTSYRIAAILKDGKTVPFRMAYTNEGGKTRQAARLQAFIN
jgi:hypothetical protein